MEQKGSMDNVWGTFFHFKPFVEQKGPMGVGMGIVKVLTVLLLLSILLIDPVL